MSAAWAWLVLAAGVVLYVAAFDLTAHRRGVLLMTVQFRDWLFDPVVGPFLWGGWIGLFAGLTWHWFVKRRTG